MSTNRTALFSVLLVGLLTHGAAGAGEFEWVPIEATGSHTIVGNQITLHGAGQLVTLQLRMSGWDPEQDNDPVLGVFQAAVDSSTYASGDGIPLSPLGWPGTPGDGCYQVIDMCDSDGSDCTGTFDCPNGPAECNPNMDPAFYPFQH